MACLLRFLPFSVISNARLLVRIDHFSGHIHLRRKRYNYLSLFNPIFIFPNPKPLSLGFGVSHPLTTPHLIHITIFVTIVTFDQQLLIFRLEELKVLIKHFILLNQLQVPTFQHLVLLFLGA